MENKDPKSDHRSSKGVTPKVTLLKTQCNKDKPGQAGSISQVSKTSYFRQGGDAPKVRIPYKTIPGQIPRELAIERLRREYLKLDIEQLLAEKDIDSNLIISKSLCSSKDETIPDNLPLETFDNVDFDCHTPEDWLALGDDEGSSDKKPIPAKALLPTDNTTPGCGSDGTESSSPVYSWQLVGVLDYSEKERQYLVEKVRQNSQPTDEEGSFINEEHKESKYSGVNSWQAGTKYWVPRIRLLFLAEDPRVLAERIEFALCLRKTTMDTHIYQLSVKYMPHWSGTPQRDTHSLQRIKSHVLSTPGLRLKNPEKCMEDLMKEVKLEYTHVMNCLTFDKVVMRNSEEFPYITLPKKEPEIVPQQGCIPVPHFDYRKIQAQFVFCSFLSKTEVIHTLSKVWSECNKVANMRLFNVTLAKPLQLDEFESIQFERHTEISLFLRDSWRITLSNSIRANLGKLAHYGDYSVNVCKWDIYKLTRLFKMMTVVRFNMEDALRYLVQNSLVSLTDFVLDTCHSVLTCPQDLVWGDDLIISPYKPSKKALFLVDLVLDQSGVHYSTPLESFVTSVINVFDKGILITHKVLQINKLVLQKMFIGYELSLDGVNMMEPQVIELREKIRNALTQAIIPLKAYAAQYEEHLDLHNMDVETLLNFHTDAELTSQEMKKVVKQHLKEKERIDNSLPSSIVIGPFCVSVHAVRQALSNKRKEVANAVLSHFAQKLRKQVDDACEECNIMSRKLSEKPKSIEELTEKRAWMKEIPEQLTSYMERIDKIKEDYELLEELHFCLSDDDANRKWAAIGWPHRIVNQMEAVVVQHVEDEERFCKMQIDNQEKLEEQLDSLQIQMAEFSCHKDIDHAHEIANEMRKTNKQLEECQTLAQIYNTRERLFGVPVTSYERLQKLVKEFKPFKDLWITASDWLYWEKSWLNDPLSSIDPEQLQRNVTDAYKTMERCIKKFKDIPDCQKIAATVYGKIEKFSPYIRLIQCLRNPGMSSCHWEMLSECIHTKVIPEPKLTVTHCLELGLHNHMAEVSEVAEMAEKEYTIQQALKKMDQDWETVFFDVLPYKQPGTYILGIPDKTSQLLDDHIVMTMSMASSPSNKSFKSSISTWESKLRVTQDVLEGLKTFQHLWIYLEPIFSTDDIKEELPVEEETFRKARVMWDYFTLEKVFKNRKVIKLCQDVQIPRLLRVGITLFEEAQKGLRKYLEIKRGSFPRFYFLTDDELLEIISRAKDPPAVQPHLCKCFANITQLQFQSDLQITHMCSGEGEEVELSSPVCSTGNVEVWLREVEKSMKTTLKDNIDRSLKVYPGQPSLEWVFSWPGQVVIAGCQVLRTAEMSEALENGDMADRLYPQLHTQLDDLVQLIRGDVSKMQQAVLSALIIIEVHAKDVAARLVEQGVSDINDFEWISQLRYYWTSGNLYIRAMNTELLYGYEYLGNSGCLIITPLTERCYLTLTGALHLNLGGALAGPAGTGKTETVKDLGKALAIQTIVFNCSNQLDFVVMGKFLKGLASSGAWVCFDEFNRISMEVSSVVAQQITTIQKAQQKRAQRFMFEGTEIPLVPSCAIFITINPSYTGYAELPDNLKVLFRPVAMMVPDYAVIAEISLYSFGFSDAKVLAKKITNTLKLSSEQLSSQDHYDFGTRAVKAVISAAGNMKRENPDMNEELICLQTIQDVSLPKLSQDDLKLFSGIVSDLFPKTKQETVNYGALEESLRNICTRKNLKDVDGYIRKCVQLYQTIAVRHGLMLVGPSGSGKTKCYETLGAAISALKGQPSVSSGVYEQVQMYVLNPKSITVGQLYGEYDLLTHEWTDGIFSSLLRGGVASVDTENKWYMFDGPVDPVWIENMNTVLDDNKKLCLSSGEIIKLTDVMTVMFEVQDLAVASPGTVSRCGMVYLEPSILGLLTFTECWMKQVPEAIKPYTEQLSSLFARFLQESIAFVRKSLKEVIMSLDSNLVCSLLKLMDCFFSPFTDIKEEKRPPPQRKLDRVKELIEPWFFFSLVWSVGATVDTPSCQHFSAWLKNKMVVEKVKLCFPEEGLVYDYRLDDAGISHLEDDDEDDERKVQWVSWMKYAKSVEVVPKTNYADVIIPTADTVRMSFLMDMLLTNKKPVLCVGPSGTGKTLTMSDKLLRNMPAEYITHVLMFSAYTSANQTQDYIDSKLYKRRKGVFGPPMGKHFIFFIDDLNMPMLETYGAQPAIELLRQWMDHRGWYDRKKPGTLKHLVDINLACAMGPPGGGRNPIIQRFLRHFSLLSFTEMDDSSKKKIFSTILGSWMGTVPTIQPLNESLVDATIQVYSAVTSKLLPTPSKSHYTFNLRDLSTVFQGIVMAESGMIEDKLQLLQLWYHESCRIFQDRLVCVEDKEWFNELLRDCLQGLGCSLEEIVYCQPVLFGDFMTPGTDHKVYKLIKDKEKLVKVMEEYMEDYNKISTIKMKLVLFMDAIEHVCRISRILRQPQGNALLLGVGGSGRKSLTKLASHMSEYDCFQIQLSKNYGQTEWRKDIKSIMLKAGLQNQQITFLFVDTQIKSESFLDDVHNILKSGDIPNLYTTDEQESILAAMMPVVLDLGHQPTKGNLMAAYTRRVQSNIHIVLCMSPVGEVFRARLRQFPSLVTYCTIDWFSPWSEEALQAVATLFLTGLPELEASPTAMEELTMMCAKIHQMVARKCEQYLTELSRYNYVTLKSYLELLKNFSDLIGRKKQELCRAHHRMKTGLDKLLNIVEDVNKMPEELQTMRTHLEEAAQDIEVAMETIKKERKIAEETQKSVQAEEAKIYEQTRFAATIEADIQRDLDEALPALDAAFTRLKSLNEKDLTEVQAMQPPPAEVKMVIEAVSIMIGIVPTNVPGEMPGTTVDDYWESGKDLLHDPESFLEMLLKYDKDNISDKVINLVQPYIDNETFQPASIAKVSETCSPICQWVQAMHAYHFVAKLVKPKKQALQEAQEDLAASQRTLDDAKEKLVAVEGGITSLQDYLAMKDDLKNKYQQYETRLTRAHKLVDRLAEEQERWTETVHDLDYMVDNVASDALLSAGYIAYLGPFTEEYRAAVVENWLQCFTVLGVPHIDQPSLISTLGDPVKIHSWQTSGLPKDNLSQENGLIAQYSKRWVLFIDPQGLANTWIKNMEQDNALQVIKLSDEDFLSRLGQAIQTGRPCLLENVGEELDLALEPVLFQQTYMEQSVSVLKLENSVFTYHKNFKLYITTKLPNPHYSPEVCSKVTLINFTLSQSGLEDQLLSQVVAKEIPNLEEDKNQLIISKFKMKQELKEIEDEILLQLSSTEGNLTDNEGLIQILDTSKIKAGEITAKVMAAEETERDIDASRLEYMPVAVRARILFFCVLDMSSVDPMYQYSLEWFLGIFLAAIEESEKEDMVKERVTNINDFFTFRLYSTVCRGLFERHRLMFSFLLCARIMMNDNKIDMAEWCYLLSGGTPCQEKNNPAGSWLSEGAWQDILGLSTLDNFSKLAESFTKHLQGFKRIFDSDQPHRELLPGEWDKKLDSFQKLLILRCVRPDFLVQGLQDFVSAQLGQNFIESQMSDVSVVFAGSRPSTPLIFVLSPGTDPAADFYEFADVMQFSKKISAISLGQGQGPSAETMMHTAMERGQWVFFQNCHLAPSWMPTLERLVENINPAKVHQDFRLWLTSLPSHKFPVSILQNGHKMTTEPPRGIKANLQKTYLRLSSNFISSSTKVTHFKSLLLSLCLFHGIVSERRKFGPLGFNIPYEFTDANLNICISQLKMFLDDYQDIPYKVLKYTAGEINYGGCVTDEWDRRCLLSVLEDFYCPAVLIDDHVYSSSGVYRQTDTNLDIKGYLAYIHGLPMNDTPEIFGLHDNANITFAQNEALTLLGTMARLQPQAASTGGKTLEETVEEIVTSISEKIPQTFNVQEVMSKYPFLYEEAMNTVLIQEVTRYNKLLGVVSQSLSDITKALNGSVVMSSELELMAHSLFNNVVPDMWKSKAYPSLKPLASWVSDLHQRISFLQSWICNGIPPVYWISGFFYPQAFLSGTLQNYARCHSTSIDRIGIDFEIMVKSVSEITQRPDVGCYIHGLFLEGARWDSEAGCLKESRPKELYTKMAVIWLIPKPDRTPPITGIYVCPIYKTLTRAGTLSKTGHSANYVMAVELPTNFCQRHWIKRGVALICSLDD